MEEVKQDVNPVEPSATEQPEAVEGQEQQKQEPVQQEQPGQVKQASMDIDEAGVPYKNRAFEWKRKAENLAEQLPLLVQESVKAAFSQYGNQQQRREYTVAELEAYALENPQYRPWAEEEKHNITLKKLASELDSKLQSENKKKEAEIRKSNSLKYVVDTYPEVFKKDANGKPMGWDQNHPLTQQIGILMQDKRLSDDPEGLVAAADIAWARYSRSNQSSLAQKAQKLATEVKSLQKKTMIEGGGRANISAVSPKKAAIDKLKQTGSIKDAKLAVFEHLKDAGVFGEQE